VVQRRLEPAHKPWSGRFSLWRPRSEGNDHRIVPLARKLIV